MAAAWGSAASVAWPRGTKTLGFSRQVPWSAGKCPVGAAEPLPCAAGAQQPLLLCRLGSHPPRLGGEA